MVMNKTIKLKIQLIQINNYLMLQHKSRQLYFHLLIYYLYLQQKLLFPSAQVSAIVLSISTSSKSSHITKVTVVETRAPDEIVTRSPIER